MPGKFVLGSFLVLHSSSRKVMAMPSACGVVHRTHEPHLSSDVTSRHAKNIKSRGPTSTYIKSLPSVRTMGRDASINEQPAPDNGPAYTIHDFRALPDGLHVKLHQHARRLTFTISGKTWQNSPVEARAFQEIWTTAGGDETGTDLRVRSYLRRVLEPLVPDLNRIAPFLNTEGKISLKDLVASSYRLTLDLHRGKLKCAGIDEISPSGQFPPDGDGDSSPEEAHRLARQLQAPFPVFGREEMDVVFTDPKRVYGYAPKRVAVGGHEYFIKQCRWHDRAESELEKHKKIFESGISPENFWCVRLYGLVEDKDGSVDSLLYHIIDEWLPLSQAVGAEAHLKSSAQKLLEKWFDQVCETVRKLHSIDVVWGDVCADNVLIDHKMDAWIVGLGGGTTRGWVDEGSQGTLEGDLQGLASLKEFIFDTGSALRSDRPPWERKMASLLNKDVTLHH